MKSILTTFLFLAITSICLSKTPAVIAGTSTMLNDEDFRRARQQYNGDSYPRQESRIPLDIQKKVLDLIGMHEILNSTNCKKLKFERLVLLRESGDLSFSKHHIKTGILNENWYFDHCGESIGFQIIFNSNVSKIKRLSILVLDEQNDTILDPNEKLYSY